MFRHHPDGWIMIGALTYPLTEFLQDEPAYSLPLEPPGIIGREYIPGKRHSLFTSNTQLGGEMPWHDGDMYIANEAKYFSKYTQKRKAENDKKTAEYFKNEEEAPNALKFLSAVRLTVFANNLTRINTAWKLQPMWYPAVKDQDWELVEKVTKAALAANDITQAEYDGIKAAAAAHHIPMTL